MWRHRGQQRPPFAVAPAPGQESVWDYPRPPALVGDRRSVRVLHGDRLLADSADTVRVLETASPPTFYIPRRDVRLDWLTPGRGSSHCEWKGEARYWSLRIGDERVEQVAWSYEDPYPEFAAIRGHLAFYPGRVACFVDGHRVAAQPGGFYGGWITPEIVGPFKGEPGTAGW
jgi:uncharacterized protein (DUF427 family)